MIACIPPPPWLYNTGMSIKTDISLGEFLDKLTILEIKRTRISDPAKLDNVDRELKVLAALWHESAWEGAAVEEEVEALRQINRRLWDIEDDIRRKEAAGEFDADFIELARSVYLTNDERARIKRRINSKLGSGIVEEKSYQDY